MHLSKLNKIKNINLLSYATLGLTFILSIFIFWPGQISPDSIIQLREAITGVYGDHHPPVMAVIWRYLLTIFPYTSGLLIFHLSLLYSSCLIFYKAFERLWLKYIYLAYPIFPPILFYSSMIWKDVGFAFSFLFAAASVTYFAMHRKKPTLLQIGVILLVLFYGSAVKFQAIYCTPFLLAALCYTYNNFKFNLKTVVLTGVSYAVMLTSLNAFNNYFVPTNKKSGSWKFVKIYDLAGMSMQLNKPLFPEYILTSKNFSFDVVKERFNYERVDDIVFFEDSPIPRVEEEKDRAALLELWRRSVIKHPLAYLKHRYKNWHRILFTKPLEKLDKLDFKQFEGMGWFVKIQNKNKTLAKLIFFVLNFIRYIFSFIFVFIFMLTYIVIGFINRRYPAGTILLLINCCAFTLVIALYFFSMASLLRYVYMPVCLVHASHALVYYCIKNTPKH